MLRFCVDWTLDEDVTQGAVGAVLVQLAPDIDTEPLLHSAEPEPEKPPVTLFAVPVPPCPIAP